MPPITQEFVRGQVKCKHHSPRNFGGIKGALRVPLFLSFLFSSLEGQVTPQNSFIPTQLDSIPTALTNHPIC